LIGSFAGLVTDGAVGHSAPDDLVRAIHAVRRAPARRLVAGDGRAGERRQRARDLLERLRAREREVALAVA
jgi:hypothetical protein